MNGEDRKSLIVSTAARMFRERGYAGTTVRDLAKEIDLTSGSIFHYFPTKEDILILVVENGLSHAEALIQEFLGKAKTPRERIRRMIEAHLTAVTEGRPEVLTVFFQERWSLTEDTLAKLLALRDRYENLWNSALADLGGKFEDAKQRKLTRLLLLGCMNSIVLWYRPAGEQKPKHIADQMMRSFIDA